MARYRRGSSIQQAPYYDSKSYDRYSTLMAGTESDAEKELLTNNLRKEAAIQPKRIGSNNAYGRWSEYNINDPNRPEMPSVAKRIGESGLSGDMRTDEYLRHTAGDIQGTLGDYKDERSQRFYSLYGPSGPLGPMPKPEHQDVALILKTVENPQANVGMAAPKYIMSAPKYYDATVAWKGIRQAYNKMKGNPDASAVIPHTDQDVSTKGALALMRGEEKTKEAEHIQQLIKQGYQIPAGMSYKNALAFIRNRQGSR